MLLWCLIDENIHILQSCKWALYKSKSRLSLYEKNTGVNDLHILLNMCPITGVFRSDGINTW